MILCLEDTQLSELPYLLHFFSVRAPEGVQAPIGPRNTPAGGLTPPAAFLQTAAASPTPAAQLPGQKRALSSPTTALARCRPGSAPNGI